MLAEASNTPTVMTTDLPLECVGRGKVRDIYRVDDERLLIVTTDRLSAFDVVLPNAIPDKGKVLTQISVFWFDYFKDIVANHLITADIHEMGFDADFLNQYGAQIEGRSMLVKKAQPLTVECIVRGYVTGSGWKDYLKSGSVCGHALPEGLQECQQLEQPLFTPSTKAPEGGHDENIDFAQTVAIVGQEIADKIQTLSIDIYRKGAEFAKEKGIIIADTKFEFGVHENELILIDEVLTPDSSRFWPGDKYEVGHDQPSFDKQIVRNYLSGLDWNKEAPGPTLPDEVVEKTENAYKDVYQRLTGKSLEG